MTRHTHLGIIECLLENNISTAQLVPIHCLGLLSWLLHTHQLQHWQSSLTSPGRSFRGVLSEMIHTNPFAQHLMWQTLNQRRRLLFLHYLTKITSASGEMLLKRGDPQNPFFFCVVPVSIISLNIVSVLKPWHFLFS